MNPTVVILGAGASKEEGLPLLGEIFKDTTVRDYLKGEALELLEFLQERFWSPRRLDLDSADKSLNIEEILTQLRDWQRDQSSSPINQGLNLRCQRMLLGCVFKAVYPDKGASQKRLLNRLIRHADKTSNEITWGTFNWDAKFEQAFFYTRKEAGSAELLPMCLPGLMDWTGDASQHLLLKLHGSVTWFKYADQSIHAVRFGSKYGVPPVNSWWSKYLSGATDAVPEIVEPSFYKHLDIEKGGFIGQQWSKFNERLAFAQSILVIGYSLPEGDAHAKSSLNTAVTNNPDAKWTIVNPAPDAQARYEKILGKNRIVPVVSGLESYLDSITE